MGAWGLRETQPREKKVAVLLLNHHFRGRLFNP
jgi:cobalamin biosynthesis Mg chelatase CobN